MWDVYDTIISQIPQWVSSEGSVDSLAVVGLELRLGFNTIRCIIKVAFLLGLFFFKLMFSKNQMYFYFHLTYEHQ